MAMTPMTKGLPNVWRRPWELTTVLQRLLTVKLPPKLRDVVGRYLDPPARRLVLSVDEKS
jgi:hypothetical protein